MMSVPMLQVTPLTPDEFDAFFTLITALADYESLPCPDDEARSRLYRDAFSTPPKFEAVLLKLDGEPKGYCIFFETYSSFLAKPTLYLEDIFLVPEARGKSLGRLAFKTLTELALSRGCGRMEWQVLDWNRLAIDFYDKLGATHQKEWFSYRLTETGMRQLLATLSELQ